MRVCLIRVTQDHVQTMVTHLHVTVPASQSLERIVMVSVTEKATQF